MNLLIKHCFSLFYIEKVETYFMAIVVSWISTYERFYRIKETNYVLYISCKADFYRKFNDEISQEVNSSFTLNFAGSNALQDYDGRKNFQVEFPLRENCDLLYNDDNEAICYTLKI